MQNNWRGFIQTMPFKLLLLTILFVLIAEILVFIPSVSKFRLDWLNMHIERAYLAGLTIYAADKTNSNKELQVQFCESIGIHTITIIDNGRRIPVKLPIEEHAIAVGGRTVDLTRDSLFITIKDALQTMLSRDNRYMTIYGSVEKQPNVFVETIVSRDDLRRDMWKFAAGILFLSAVICIIVAGLVYLTLFRIFVGPMVRLTATMAAFQKDPSDGTNMMQPSGRADEIGEAEQVLAQMQARLRNALDQQNRFATLGQSVSKINHDLRNILTSAVLISDRLSKSDDPAVQRLAPRLVKSLDRAASLCTATLDYGRVEEIKPDDINLFDLIEDVSDTIAPLSVSDSEGWSVVVENTVSADLVLTCDRVQMFRALSNLLRNACQAMEERAQKHARILISAQEYSDSVAIRIQDNGPGIREDVAENLFTPFKGSTKIDGNGLGLAIVYEIVRTHEGTVELTSTGDTGTVFEIKLPFTPKA